MASRRLCATTSACGQITTAACFPCSSGKAGRTQFTIEMRSSVCSMRNSIPMNCRFSPRTCLPAVSFFLVALFLLAAAPAGFGQASATITGTVVDATGDPVAGAQIQSGSGDLLATTGADGRFTIPADAGAVSIEATHFAPATITIGRQAPLRIELVHPFENVTVTAYRSPLSSLDSPASTRILNTPSPADGRVSAPGR